MKVTGGATMTPPRRRVETPAARRARILRYRTVYAERYGRGPLRLSECAEYLPTRGGAASRS